jgi:hypothetical protein
VKIRVIKTLIRKRIKNIVDIAKCLNKRLPLHLVFLCDVDIDSIPRYFLWAPVRHLHKR